MANSVDPAESMMSPLISIFAKISVLVYKAERVHKKKKKKKKNVYRREIDNSGQETSLWVNADGVNDVTGYTWYNVLQFTREVTFVACCLFSYR